MNATDDVSLPVSFVCVDEKWFISILWMDDNDQHPLTKYVINVKDVVGYVQQLAQGCCGLSFDCSQCVPQVPNVLP